MVRLIVILCVFGMLACGGSDTAQTGDAGGAAPGGESASAPETPKPPATPTPPAAPEPSAKVDFRVRSCLDLVSRGKFEQALPLCLAALKIDPDNQEVQDAVDKARAETAKVAAAETAGEAAGEAAAGKAASELEEATGGAAEKLGQ